MPAQPNDSAIYENPGPDVHVDERVPVREEPIAIQIADISSSV